LDIYDCENYKLVHTLTFKERILEVTGNDLDKLIIGFKSGRIEFWGS